MKNVKFASLMLFVLMLCVSVQAAVTVTTGPEANLNLLSGAPVYTGGYATYTFAQATTVSLGQTFTMGEESIAVTSVNLTYENSLTVAATLTMRIFEVANPVAGTISVPGTTLLTETFVAPNVGGTDTLLTITLGSPVVLKYNTSYAVFIDVTDASAKSNFCWFRTISTVGNNGDVYAGGAFYQDGAIKTGGERDGSLALTGEVAVGGRTHTPNPSNGATVYSSEVAGLSDVSWFSPLQDKDGNPITEPNIVSVDGYDVYWSIIDPNFVGEAAASVNQAGQSFTPTPAITYNTTYYWRVDTYVTFDSNELSSTGGYTDKVEGAQWQFTTEPQYIPPVIETYNNVITTVGIGSGDLSAIITGNSDPIISVTWALLADDTEFPAGSDAILTPTTIDNQSPTATLTTAYAGTYKVKLVIYDGTTSDEAIAEIEVYADACQAQKDAGIWTANPYDFDGNCLVDILDFVAVAAVWLDDTSMGTQVGSAGVAGYVPLDVFNARIEADSHIDLNDPNSCSNWPLGPGADGVPDTDPNSTTYNGIRIETTRPNATDSRNLGSANSTSWVVYQVNLAPGTYDVYAAWSKQTAGDQTLSFGTAAEPALYGTGTFPTTGNWNTFVKRRVGQVTITEAITSIRTSYSGGFNLDWFSFDLQE